MKQVFGLVLVLALVGLLLGGVMYVLSRGAKGLGRVEAQVIVELPKDELEKWLFEPKLIAEWKPGVNQASAVTGEPGKVGYVWLELTGKETGKAESYRLEVVREKGLSKTIWLRGEEFRRVQEYFFESLERKTRLTLIETTQYKPFRVRLLEPWVTLKRKQTVTKELERLKEEVGGEKD